jgi:predicted CopG family antitoxin
MDFSNKPDTYKKGSDGVSQKYLYDIEKQLYNIAMNYMPHLKESDMNDKIEELTQED